MKSQHLNKTDPLNPATLRLPIRPPKLIYLDLKDWILLSKVRSRHQDVKDQGYLLEACLNAVEDGEVVFPLSEYVYSEISKIRNYRQRRDLREVIEQVSKFRAVTSLTNVVTREIEAMLDRIVGPNPTPVTPTDYLGWGIGTAIGGNSDIGIVSEQCDDVTEMVRSMHPAGPVAFDAAMSNAQLEIDRMVIDGPTPDEEPRLRAEGWRPEVVVSVYERQATEELAQVRRFDDNPEWRRGRIRDAIATRHLISDVGGILTNGLESRGPDARDVFFAADGEDLRSMVNAMPSSDVTVTLKTSLHRDAHHRWKKNDIYDMRALSLTIPYCDVVVTDRSMRSHVTRNKLPERYGTVVISQLSELPEHLRSD